jgi:PEGA domain
MKIAAARDVTAIGICVAEIKASARILLREPWGSPVVKRALLTSACAIAALTWPPGLGSAGQFVVYPSYPVQYVGPDSSVRLEVKPKEAEVFVDGYYAGIVDDFDGTFQRLRLPPGQHEIQIYLSGYRTVHQHLFLTPDNTFKLKYQMEKLGPGDQPEPRPVPPPPSQMAPPPDQEPPYPPPGRPGRLPPQQPPPQAQDPRGSRPPGQPALGTLAIRVQPLDADLFVDGERWQGPQANDRLLIELPEGRHTLELRKPGFRTYITDVDIHPGETTPVNISLRSQGDQ